MKVLSRDDQFKALNQKYGPILFLCFSAGGPTESHFQNDYAGVMAAAPFLKREDILTLLLEEELFIACKSEAEAYELFEQVRGDDCPSKTYDGPYTVYASVFFGGKFQTENT